MPIRQTHTYVILDLSKPAFEEIKKKLEDAGYQHAFDKDDERGVVIDMHGIAIAVDSEAHEDPKPVVSTLGDRVLYVPRERS